MIKIEEKEKITKVEEILKMEASTINNLKTTNTDNKKYLMTALEKLSNNFNSDNIIEESYMLPQLFRTLNDSLSKVNSNLLILQDLENSINSILFSISIQNSNSTIDIDDLTNQLNLYNLKKMESKTTILNNTTYIEKFKTSTQSILNNLIGEVENSKDDLIKKFKENRNKEEINTNKDDLTLYKPYKVKENDTLLISEKQAKIFLPYSLKDLFEFTSDNSSLEDVIKDNFILPLSKFKNPTISRFKETYNLAKNKSNCSILKSFNFAVEVMFKYSLNPAIIIACKNIDELKDYLNCLKDQKLDLFKAFKIRYEINPMKI